MGHLKGFWNLTAFIFVVCMPFLVICKNDPGAFLQVLVRIDRGGQCDTDTWKLQERIVRGLTNNFGGLVTTFGLQCDYNCNRTWSWYKREHGIIVFCMFYPVDKITELTSRLEVFQQQLHDTHAIYTFVNSSIAPGYAIGDLALVLETGPPFLPPPTSTIGPSISPPVTGPHNPIITTIDFRTRQTSAPVTSTPTYIGMETPPYEIDIFCSQVREFEYLICVMNHSAVPTPLPVTQGPPTDDDNTSTIAGGTLGALGALAASLLAGFAVYRRFRKNKVAESDDMTPVVPVGGVGFGEAPNSTPPAGV